MIQGHLQPISLLMSLIGDDWWHSALEGVVIWSNIIELTDDLK